LATQKTVCCTHFFELLLGRPTASRDEPGLKPEYASEIEFWLFAVYFSIGSGGSDVCAEATIANFITLRDANSGGEEFHF